jgi:hypothetical protein
VAVIGASEPDEDTPQDAVAVRIAPAA